MKIKILIHNAEEGGYWAEVPSLPGCFTQGETVEEITNKMQEAVEGWLRANEESSDTEQKDAEVLELVI